MSKQFKAKDYIIDIVDDAMNELSQENYVASPLEDGKKGFVITRGKKSMTVRYEDGQIIDESGYGMPPDAVYKFISSLTSHEIPIPPETGFSKLIKQKKQIDEFYALVRRGRINDSKQHNLYELVTNGLATIGFADRHDGRAFDKTFDCDILQKVASVLLKYMTRTELQEIVGGLIMAYPTAVAEPKKTTLVKSTASIDTLLEYYTPEELGIYLDEWMVSVQHVNLPKSRTLKGLFEGFQIANDCCLPDIDMADGKDVEYGISAPNEIDKYVDQETLESLDHYKTPRKERAHEIPNRYVFNAPSRQKIKISIQDFTQMAVYGAIAQGYAPQSIDYFLYIWRKHIDWQLYYYGEIKEAVPRNILTETAVYDQKTVEIVKEKAVEAYRAKREFYEELLEYTKLPVPYRLNEDLTLVLASEEEVRDFVGKYYRYAHKGYRIGTICHMFSSNSIPLSIRNTQGTVLTQFYDLTVMTSDKVPSSFIHNGKEYACAKYNAEATQTWYQKSHPWKLPFENPLCQYAGSHADELLPMMRAYFEAYIPNCRIDLSMG